MLAIPPERIDEEYRALKAHTEQAGYRLNPDEAFVKDIVRGILENEQRYGYQSCPCRLSSGNADEDRDIVCPCDYRDADIAAYGCCYCALYVSEKVFRGEQSIASIPERRPARAERLVPRPAPQSSMPRLSVPVWRCTVCGYLCGRDEPPETCPICKAKKDRFERFI